MFTQVPTTSNASKRRKTSSSRSPSRDKDNEQVHTVSLTTQYVATASEGCAQNATALESGVTFGDFPSNAALTLDSEPSNSSLDADSPSTLATETAARDRPKDLMSFCNDGQLAHESEKSSLPDAFNEYQGEAELRSLTASSMKSVSSQSALSSESVIRVNQKKRRRASLNLASNGGDTRPTDGSSLALSTNNTILNESLLKIYHNSFENALHCWLNESTCPYSNYADVALVDYRPDWNRIYHRVFRLDRRSANIRGRQLTYSEDTASTKALNMAIYAFATQWSQSGENADVEHAFDEFRAIPPTPFENDLQINAWHEARNALNAAGDVESFRVVLAQMIFALTQKPVEHKKQEINKGQHRARVRPSHTNEASDDDIDVDECDDLLARLDLAFEADGPPMHLERGLRLLHSLRSRIAMRTGTKQYHASTGQLDDTDRAAIDLLFWLGVMFDTLSAAMHKRPLVVSDEDCDIYPQTGEDDVSMVQDETAANDMESKDRSWDEYLFARLEKQLHDSSIRWPCSFDQAAAHLRAAAPVKVVLFRRITRIQNLLGRSARGVSVEASLTSALEVYALWERLCSPFIRDCVQNHDRLHPRIQSWYTCLAAHWHLATLLLADLLELVDDSSLGVAKAQSRRVSTSFIAHFREYNCRTIADIAGRACPRADASFSKSDEFHFALNKGSLLTEPWTVVLIRTFAKAGVLLLESNLMLPLGDNFERADPCVRALWYLGRKSDMARRTWKILSDALRERRKGLDGTVSDMSSFMNNEMWYGLEDLDAPFDNECDR